MKQPEESEIPPQAGKQSEAGSEQRDSISPSDLAAIIARATDYARRGWSVIPVGINKKPTVKAWKARQSVRADAKDVSKWFHKQQGLAGVGIVLGEVSGGLYVRDFDDAATYELWAAAHAELAKRLPTVQTSRGFHVYARWPRVKTKEFPTGELRGEGAYVCAPPSTHKHGAIYSWLVPLPEGELELIDPKVSGLAHDWSNSSVVCATERTERTERPRGGEDRATRDAGANREIEHTEAMNGTGIDAETLAKVKDAIERTLPPMHGKRNKHLFRLARALKGIPAFRQFTRKDLPVLRPYVHEWHRRALPNILTKDWAFSWGEFGYAWERVKFPEGDDAIAQAMERAESATPPEWSKDYSPQLQLLGSLCRELQRAARDGHFFLSNELAAQLLDVDKGTANRWFHAMRNDGVLIVVEEPTNGRATRYKYVADDL